MALFGRSKSKLTPKQLAQRKYASRMRAVRKRAKGATGGRGRIGKRSAASTLRRKLGLKTVGRKTRKAVRKTGRTGRTTARKTASTVRRRF